jgi:hypothetical protein
MSHITTAEDLLAHAVLMLDEGRPAAATLCRRRRLTDFMRRGEHRGWPLFLKDPRARCPQCSQMIKQLRNPADAAEARSVVIGAGD